MRWAPRERGGWDRGEGPGPAAEDLPGAGPCRVLPGAAAAGAVLPGDGDGLLTARGWADLPSPQRAVIFPSE